MEGNDIKSTDVKKVPIEQIIKNIANVNEMEDADFNDLVEKIKIRGFDQPIKVWWNEEIKRFEVIKGNHRYEAARFLGLKEVPCIVGDYPSRDEAMADGMSDNITRGKINPEKFTAEWDRMKKKYGTDKLMSMMVVTSHKNLDKFINEVRKTLPAELKEKFDKAKKDIKNADDLALTVNRLWKEYGKSMEHGYMFFPYGGKVCLIVQMSEELRIEMDKFCKLCVSKEVKIAEVLLELVKKYNESNEAPAPEPAKEEPAPEQTDKSQEAEQKKEEESSDS